MEPTKPLAIKRPAEIEEYLATFYANMEVTVFDYERYENIIKLDFKAGDRYHTAYIPVKKENRMSDSNGCG